MRNSFGRRFLLLAVALLSATVEASATPASTRLLGAAKVDITPDYAIRLSGYGSRRLESEGIEQRIWAKALAFGSDAEGAAVLITVDNCGVPGEIREEVARRLARKAHLKNERLAISSSHTHSAPCLKGLLPNLFSQDIPPEHQTQIDRYTKELTDKLEHVALAALADRRPGRLAWSQGKVGFAANRRTPGGPVDHDLPIMCVTDPAGKVRAVLANYACHCTTVSLNRICGDWAGYAQEAIERDNPGAIALVAIGCGADANPSPRNTYENARQHGEAISQEVKRLLARPLSPLTARISCRTETITLPFDPLPTRAEWEEKARDKSAPIAYHARRTLAKLDRGETIPTALAYLVQTWNLGEELAMVFLPGEVVVDYALRLKREFDPRRLWVNGYANDVPCYVPSRRILTEGGYEGGGAMVYYDRPTRFAPAVEDLIIGAVHNLLPKQFLAKAGQTDFPPPLSPQESLAAMRTKPDLTVELAAAEPLVVDPVAIDWGADGKLWVIEMRDYPTGIDRHWKPGGRVKLLSASRGDGKYDRATVFLDHLPFPTGIMAWRKGVLICAAPDIIYAEDTDGDGKADVVKKLFTGFFTDNYQARVNSLSLGLDGWVYGANGLLGGIIHGAAGGQEINIRGQDFRMNPDTGAFEAAAGLTQQGRVRDDWGNWFGCDNSTLIRHYPLPDHYVRRNPHVTAPNPGVFVPGDADPNQLFPTSRTLARYNDPGSANRTTSACGLGLYRDDLLGPDFYGNAFICEPVHNLVHRLKLEPRGVTFTGLKPADELRSEFLSSPDNWFRPVQVRTGPDGALWVVDMYRYLIEHPRWVPADQLAKIDVRAGEDKGRIYRLFPRGKKLRPIRDLTKITLLELATALDTPNGTERDRVQLELLRRQDQAAAKPLAEIALKSARPEVRVQALSALDGLHLLSPSVLQQALADVEPRVRRQAILLSERPAVQPSDVTSAALALAEDPDPRVRFQLALSLGEWQGTAAGQALGNLAKAGLQDSWLRAAILSSAPKHSGEILAHLAALPESTPGLGVWMGPLIATVTGVNDETAFTKVFAAALPAGGTEATLWQLSTLASVLDALERQKLALSGYLANHADLRELKPRLSQAFADARKLAGLETAAETKREAAIRLLGRGGEHAAEELQFLATLLNSTGSVRLRNATLASLRRTPSPQVSELLLSGWKTQSPSLRGEILSVLLSREQWIIRLLAAIQQGAVQSSELPLADRQRLRQHPNAEIRQQASVLFSSGDTTGRAEVLRKFQGAVALSGDAAKGAESFAHFCATCHDFRGQGFEVGPNLAALRDKDGDYWLKNILDPNAVVEPRFVSYLIDTKDGRSLSGVVSAETSTGLTLTQAGGVTEKILRRDIAEIRASEVSLMPEGLEQNLTLPQFADLLAYLKSGPAEFGSATAEQAARARQQFLAVGHGGLGKIISASERLSYPSWLGVLPMPHCRQTDGQSKLVWQTPARPTSLPPDSVQQFRLPAAMGFISQPAGNFQLKLNGKSALEFNVTRNDQSWRSADGTVRLSYTVMQTNGEDSNGVLLIEVSGTRLEAGKPATFEVTGSAAGSQRWFGVYLLNES